jgi:hypothetical protein
MPLHARRRPAGNEPEDVVARQLREGKVNRSPQEAQMSFATRLLPLIALFAAPFCAAAQTPDYEVGASLVCDTQAQVERFVALFNGDAPAAVRVLNAEEKNPAACAIINVAFMRGAKLGTVRHGDKAFEIVRILVVGVEIENGIRPVSPAAYFSLFGVTEYDV